MNKVSPADRGDPWIVEREGVVGSFWGFGFDCSGLLKDSREIFFSFEGGGGEVEVKGPCVFKGDQLRLDLLGWNMQQALCRDHSYLNYCVRGITHI